MGMKKSAPKYTLFRKIEAMFEKDPCVDVSMDEKNNIIMLCVTGSAKAEAIRQILPFNVTLGEEVIDICIKYNVDDALSAVYRTAFYGNPIVQEIVDSGPNDDFCYVVFAPEIIQFFDDNLGDPHGNTTTLASTIADEIFDETDGVFFTEGPKK